MLTGHCECGAITYEIDADPMLTALCHCEDCQRMSGSAFTTNVVVPKAAVQVQGETLTTYRTVGEDTGKQRLRKFCSTCGSHLFSEMEEMPDAMVVKAGTLDDTSVVTPTMELWTTSAQAWTQSENGQLQVLERGLPAA